MLFHIHGIHIAVFVERKREPFDGPIRVFERIIVAEGFFVELDGHLSISNDVPTKRLTQGMIFLPEAWSSASSQ